MAMNDMHIGIGAFGYGCDERGDAVLKWYCDMLSTMRDASL